jgi:hypothetical protein
MKDQLLDIVQHTHGLGVIDLVKVVGTEQETTVNAIAEDRSVMVEAKFAGPVADFVGTFGMPNLGKLNTVLNISEYKEGAKTDILKQNRNGEDVPVGIHFENKTGDFKNDYRFMTAEIINDKLKTVKFKGVKWGVEVEPTNLGIQRLKFQASANSEETTFIAKTNKGDLEFYFGDHSSHAGNFVFANGVSGSLSKAWAWPVGVVISILNLPGDKMLRISDEGAAQITVNSGIAIWNYTLPAQTK